MSQTGTLSRQTPPHPSISLDKDSPELAAAYEETSVHQFNHGKTLIAALRVTAEERVLDVGAGTGRLAAFVADLVGQKGSVVAIDPLPWRVDIAQRKSKPNFEVRVGRAEDLSEFDDASFDVVYLNSVFHWVADKPRALAEIFRVLKPGGRFGVNSANPLRPHQFTQLVRDTLVSEGVGEVEQAGALYAVDRARLESLVAEAGFVGFNGQEHTFIDHHPDIDSLLTWSSSSSFGNFLSGLSGSDRIRLRSSLAKALEEKRTPNGIRLERYLVFATARKPQVAGKSLVQ
jgi:ubiquinone/menaquinone biosynthesis C-methylase UbiE